MTKKKFYLICVVCFVLALILDQVTKLLAVMHLKGKSSFSLIDGVFELSYVENTGAAFGIMRNHQFIFVIVAALIFLAVLYIFLRIPVQKKYVPLQICLVFLCAGALGNMIDRIRLNYVIDFLYFSLIDFPVFNAADCYVTVTCFALVILILFYYKDEKDFDFFKRRKK